MKRFTILSLILVLISITILGCQPQDNKESNNKINLKGELKEIDIYKSNDFDEESSELIISFIDEESLKIFYDAITNAVRQEGVVSVNEPDYDLEIIYEDDTKEQLYLWLLEGGKGSLMKLEDSTAIYNFSNKMNEKLINLIDSK